MLLERKKEREREKERKKEKLQAVVTPSRSHAGRTLLCTFRWPRLRREKRAPTFVEEQGQLGNNLQLPWDLVTHHAKFLPLCQWTSYRQSP